MYYFAKIGKNLEHGLKEEGLLKFVRELNGNDVESYEIYLRDASMYGMSEKTDTEFNISTIKNSYSSSGDSVGARKTRTEIHVGGPQIGYDEGRLCVSGCGNISSKFLSNFY